MLLAHTEAVLFVALAGPKPGAPHRSAYGFTDRTAATPGPVVLGQPILALDFVISRNGAGTILADDSATRFAPSTSSKH